MRPVSSVAGPQGPAGAASTVAGLQGPAGSAPLGSASSVLYLASSGVAAARTNLLINTSHVTCTLPLYANVIAGSSSSIPGSVITGIVALARTAGTLT